MKNMKKIVLALSAAATFAAFTSFALAAQGADPQTTVAVKAMFDAMQIRKNMEAMYSEMQKAMPGIMRQQVVTMIQADTRLDAEQKKAALAKFEEQLPGLSKSIVAIFNDPTMIDDMVAEMVPLYANNYTLAEIKELTAFYESPVGRKMMTLTPKLAAEGMAIGQRVMAPRLGKLMQDVAQEVQKK